MNDMQDPIDTHETVSGLRAYLREQALTVVWRQWKTIGGMTAADRRAKSLVDPEALILVSLALSEDEPRLNDVLGDWAVINSDLISVQRTRNLSKQFVGVRSPLKAFAQTAFAEGKDHRWKALMGNGVAGLERRRSIGKQTSRAIRAQPIEAPALVLRLRLAFGVGIKADILAFLLSTEQEAWASVAVISAATGYTVAAVRKALSNLAEARFVEQMDDTRVEYHVNHSAWRELLDISDLPTWRGWAVRYAFVSDFLAWATVVEGKPMSPYLLDSRGGALLQKHAKAFRWQRVLNRNEAAAGGRASTSVRDAVHLLGEWMTSAS